jgi:hypothetical protein
VRVQAPKVGEHGKASCALSLQVGRTVAGITRPAWAGFKTAEEGIAISMSYIL